MRPAAGGSDQQTAAAPAAALHYMGLALQSARRAGLAGEAPIGACLVRDGEVVATAANAVISGPDAAAHAEICLIREACRRLRCLTLEGCELFVTVEPCPMCLAACHYARIERITFAARLADLQAITGGELMDARLPVAVELAGDCRRDEAVALLRDWAARRRS